MGVAYNSILRKVRRGSVSFDGRKYYSDELKSYEGQFVEVDMVLMKDITKRKVFSSDGKFICEAVAKIKDGNNG